MNSIQATHLFLMRRCDGGHHQRFVQCLINTPFNPNTKEGLANFNRKTHEEQIQYIVKFWALQLGICGIHTTEQSLQQNCAVATNDLTRFLENIRPYIEEHQLPRLN